MKAIQKLYNNLLTSRAISVLGAVQYARYLATFLMHLPDVIRIGDLCQVDEAMGVKTEKFRYRDTDFLFDCRFCDEYIRDGTFAFGIVREIYIRDCYFKHLPPAVYANARTVIDLGANRGAFSVLVASRAKVVLSVEAQEQFVPVIRHNMQKNGHQNYDIEIGFVGAGGSLAAEFRSTPSLTIHALLNRYNLKQVDLLKMDIEGSEFALFNSSDWLQHVNAISMEIHPFYGDASIILELLTRHGFTFVIADENLSRVTDAKSANFIYAWRNG